VGRADCNGRNTGIDGGKGGGRVLTSGTKGVFQRIPDLRRRGGKKRWIKNRGHSVFRDVGRMGKQGDLSSAVKDVLSRED